MRSLILMALLALVTANAVGDDKLLKDPAVLRDHRDLSRIAGGAGLDDRLLKDPAVLQDLGFTAGQTEWTTAQLSRYAQIRLQAAGFEGLVSYEFRRECRRLNLSDAQRRQIIRSIREFINDSEILSEEIRILYIGASDSDFKYLRQALEDGTEANSAKARKAAWGVLSQSQRAMYLRMVGPPVTGRPSWVDPFR